MATGNQLPRLLAFVLLLSAMPVALYAQTTIRGIDFLRAQYALADDAINYTEVKLGIDAIVNPEQDREHVLASLDAMTDQIRASLPKDAATRDKIAAIRRHIYEGGQWNEGRPFKYDLSDPLGKEIQNKLLSTYIEKRLGNCVSMPILFLILADRLDVRATLATAPFHIFVQYYDDELGQYLNLETTSGANLTRDDWFIEQLGITDDAIESGIYLRTLSRKEVVGVIGSLLFEHYNETKQYRELLSVAQVIYNADRKNVDALISTASAAGRMIEEYRREYPDWDSLNAVQQRQFQWLANANDAGFKHAESLGWRPLKERPVGAAPSRD